MLDAEIAIEPAVKTSLAIPRKSVQVITDRMERPFARAQINRLVRGILAHGHEARELQPFLHRGNVIVAHRPRQIARIHPPCWAKPSPAAVRAACRHT